jgi:hypothetical protein
MTGCEAPCILRYHPIPLCLIWAAYPIRDCFALKGPQLLLRLYHLLYHQPVKLRKTVP